MNVTSLSMNLNAKAPRRPGLFAQSRARGLLSLVSTLAIVGPLALVTTALGAQSVSGRGEASSERQRVRGVTVSTHGGGQEWATDEMPGTFANLKALGANWVAIHPYARIADDGSVRFRGLDRENPPEQILRPIRDAHAQGLKILIKPHLAYWGSSFDWRGDITFDSDEQWQRFWKDYREWMLLIAEISGGADAIAVGTELDMTLHFDDQWRALIKDIRDRSSAPLTYAANWTDYEKVGFWDALDAIGIQAYFPLSQSERPSEPELTFAWAQLMAKLSEFSEKQGKDIVFTELGYNQSFAAAREPWSPTSDGPPAGELQRTCMRIALAAIEDEPRVVGAFLWKWFPGPRPAGSDFRLAYPEMEQVIRSVWK